MPTATTVAYAINRNDSVQTFAAATSCARALDLKVPPPIDSAILFDQTTENVGLSLNEYETICEAQEWNVAAMLNRRPLSLKDNVLI